MDMDTEHYIYARVTIGHGCILIADRRTGNERPDRPGTDSRIRTREVEHRDAERDSPNHGAQVSKRKSDHSVEYGVVLILLGEVQPMLSFAVVYRGSHQCGVQEAKDLWRV